MTNRVQAQAFLNTVIEPACQAIGYWSPAAGVLLLGTAIQESQLCYRRQIGGGPGLGLFQCEPSTYRSLHDDFLRYRPALLAKVQATADRTEWPEPEWLVTHDRFSAAIARCRYLWAPEALPAADDIPAMAAYWSRHYNTRNESDKIQQFIDNWHAVMGED